MDVYKIYPVIPRRHNLNPVTENFLGFLGACRSIYFLIVHGNLGHGLRCMQYIIYFIYMKLVPLTQLLHKRLIRTLHIRLGTSCSHKGGTFLASDVFHYIFQNICRDCHFLNNLSLIGNDSTVSCNKINIIFHRCKDSGNTVIFPSADCRKNDSFCL